MVISHILLIELVNLQKEIYYITKNHIATQKQIENFLNKLELRRMNILNQIKVYNKTVGNENNKIDYIDERYKAYMEQDCLRLYIPETLPKFKNISRATHKRIMLNVADITAKFSKASYDNVFVYIKIFDRQPLWDLDNRTIKPVLDGLVLSNMIPDDNYNKVIICTRGFYAENLHTEITIADSEIVEDFLEKYQ